MKHFNAVFLISLASLIISCKSAAPTDPAVKNTHSKASGRVTLTVKIDGTKSWLHGDFNEQKTMLADASFVFDFAEVAADVASNSRSFNWDNTGYGGTAFWFTEFKRTYTCNNSKITDIDSSNITFSSAAAGLQSGGGMLVLNDDGSYTLAVHGNSLPVSNISESSYTYCPPNHSSSNNPSYTPFQQYWTPIFNGGSPIFNGTVTAASPNRVNGSFHGVDSLSVFSQNLMVINMPIDVTIVWDLSLQ
jgi:hypothetical protein